jgi:small-conductance mechanosensitive channel
MKKKLLTLGIALCVCTLPLWAIVSGRSLTNTLKELCTELQTACIDCTDAQQGFKEDYERQHQKMIDVITKSNKLSILLYTQEQEMTFDLAYALKNVSRDYKDFNKDRQPYDRIVNSLNIEIDRYSRLIEALCRIPPVIREVEVEIAPDSLFCHNDSLEVDTASASTPLEREVMRIAIKDSLSAPFVLDEEGEIYRDSCIRYATELLKMYADNRAALATDSTHYQMAYQRMNEAYEYANSRYQKFERYVFIDGQTPFLDILANPGYHWSKTVADMHRQYSFTELFFSEDNSADSTVTYDAEKRAAELSLLSSKGENALLVFFCVLQLIFLIAFWLIAFLIIRLIHRHTKLKHIVNKKKLKLFSILMGTIPYFLVVGFFWRGDEYVQLSAKHINTFLWLLMAISGSLLLRVKADQLRHGLQLYSPTFLVALMIIICRITFTPDRLMNFLFPPILFLIVLRQLFFCIRERGKATSIDSTLGWASLAIYLVAFVFAFVGYTFVALLILIWWYFQLAALLTIVCISDLLSRYKQRWLDRRVTAMRSRITYVTGEDRESLLFGATWFYDLIKKVAIPAMILLSLPLCIRLSLNVFDFGDLFQEIYYNPFVLLFDKDGVGMLRISGSSIINLLILFFILRYLNMAIHAIWRYARYATFMRKHNRTTIRANEINLSLGNSIISALTWMVYTIVVIYIWQIPTGSLGLIAGGLSAGIGLALKDTINNFIYGIQLMGGRLRVGDWIECDGVRGRVVAINYQCVQIETLEGTEMSFLNASLFGKNFNNLTRNNSYEYTKIIVGVAYGTDIKKVREVLVQAMQQMRTKDQYGRDIVDPKKGIYVVVDNMSESAVDIAVKQYVLVAERIEYVDRSKEVIYEALNAAGIPIAFPQCDVHLIQEE